MLTKGLRRKPTSYRDGQNVIRDSGSGAIVCLPPEAGDVPLPMGAMTAWLAYFLRTTAAVFTAVKDEALRLAAQGSAIEPEESRRLDQGPGLF
ncbi:MAG: hypothetical protein M0Z41_01365 [Peptococcaceae bacterium]|jgi:hypothetical protein|nr:hypothetical protein [Peptococcaceae bacterium]